MGFKVWGLGEEWWGGGCWVEDEEYEGQCVENHDEVLEWSALYSGQMGSETWWVILF